MRTVFWDYNSNQLNMIDQRLLPSTFEIAVFDDYHNVAKAITDMVIRGAPAIGAAAAFGLALAAIKSKATSFEELRRELNTAADLLLQSRPTAINLHWAIHRVLSHIPGSCNNVDELRQFILNEAQAIADEDIEINKRMAKNGAQLIQDGDTIIHHCNTGALATVDWGTALGVIRMAHDQGKHIHVLVDETRPRLQGARLTAWELSQYKIPYDIITDNAAGYFLHSGQVQKVLFGADRVASNGDVANKIGTYMLALAAFDNNVPAFSVVPTSTIDLSLNTGNLIPIEERPQAEVLDITIAERKVSPEGATAKNPAFDITPNRLITGIITENGIVYPPYDENLQKVVITTTKP